MQQILIINHKEKACGIHQYGEDIYNALKKSTVYKFRYAECSNPHDLKLAVSEDRPDAIIYNYYPFTMPWLTKDVLKWYNDAVQLAVFHEVTQEDADKATNDMFDYWLCPDPTLKETGNCIRTKRLIPEYKNTKPHPDIPVIGSFGFGYHGKGFELIIQKVQEEFDNAIINLHIPDSDVVGTHWWSRDNPKKLRKKLIQSVAKPGISINITNHFMSKQQLLDFLAGNSINCFFYDVDKYKGISSVIDSALAVQRPIAITKCKMFRHIISPEICITDSSLKFIIKNGVDPLRSFYHQWSEKEFVSDYERILKGVLGGDTASTPQS